MAKARSKNINHDQQWKERSAAQEGQGWNFQEEKEKFKDSGVCLIPYLMLSEVGENLGIVLDHLRMWQASKEWTQTVFKIQTLLTSDTQG